MAEASLRSLAVKATLLRVEGNSGIMGMGDKGLIRTHHQTKKKKETVKQPVKSINLPSFSNYDIPQRVSKVLLQVIRLILK